MILTAEIYILRHCSFFRLFQESYFDRVFRDSNADSMERLRIWNELKIESLEISDYLEKNQRQLQQCAEWFQLWREKMGIQTLTPFDDSYPKSFYQMKDPPWLLFFRGQPTWKTRPFLSVVGSREMTHETALWMELHLSEFLKQKVGGLASGGARGVDSMAHQLCLRHNQPTIAFLPSGLARLYPRDFEQTAERIIDQGGALMSEYEPFVEMHKRFFYARNRLIAAFGVMTLITQAHRRSGTMLTAQHAIENSKPLAVVPAHPQQVHYSGNLKLLSEGAFLLCDAQELTNIFLSEVSHVSNECLYLGGDLRISSIASGEFKNDIDG